MLNFTSYTITWLFVCVIIIIMNNNQIMIIIESVATSLSVLGFMEQIIAIGTWIYERPCSPSLFFE